MKRLLSAFLGAAMAAFVAISPVGAQQSLPNATNVPLSLSTCSSTVTVPVQGYSSLGFSIHSLTSSGATVTFKASADFGTAPTVIQAYTTGGTAASTATTDNNFQLSTVGMIYVQMITTTCSSGTAYVSWNLSNATFSPPGGGGGGGGCTAPCTVQVAGTPFPVTTPPPFNGQVTQATGTNLHTVIDNATPIPVTTPAPMPTDASGYPKVDCYTAGVSGCGGSTTANYTSTLPTCTTGTACTLQTDVNGLLYVADLANRVSSITNANEALTTCTLLQSAPGWLQSIVNTGPQLTVYIQFYDTNSTSGCTQANLRWGDGSTITLGPGQPLNLNIFLVSGLAYYLSAALPSTTNIIVNRMGP